MSNQPRHPKSLARDYAVQFLYQCECERVFYFSEAHFGAFAANFAITKEVARLAEAMVAGSFAKMPEIDAMIEGVATNWKLDRMAATDRSVLRLATYELLAKTEPKKVIINEAIDLAKKYGTAQSGSFVNGILDKIAEEYVS